MIKSPKLPPVVEIQTSPHLHNAPSVEQIMRNVVYALLPLAAYAIYLFGISALFLILICVVSARLTEHLFSYLGDSELPTDLSSVITGILLALTLPPGFPFWMAAIAGFVSIAMGKVMFGGLGFNPFNPALLGRAFVQAAFPVAITTWTPPMLSGRFMEFIPSSLALPFMTPASVNEWVNGMVDGYSGATPLAQWKFAGEEGDTLQLLLGSVDGSAGETSALLILACGAYLVYRKMMDWRIPAYVLGGAFVSAFIFNLYDASSFPTPLFVLFSGGLMLGAVFMASDMVGTPVTPMGVAIYGLLIGLVTVIIRYFGGLPEGVMYAILLGNAMTPLIEQMTQPRVYGTKKVKGRGHS